MKSSSKEVEIECEVVAKTEKAWKVVTPTNLEGAWVPVSQISDYCEEGNPARVTSIFVTQWMAEQKGLV